MPRAHRRPALRGAVVTAAAAATALAGAAPASAATLTPDNVSKALEGQTNTQVIVNHMKELQRIADANGGQRASGFPGYEASADYVAAVAREAGLDVTVQEFDFPFFDVVGQPEVEQVAPVQNAFDDALLLDPDEPTDNSFTVFSYSGSGDVTAPVTGVDLALDDPATSTSGCEAEDFADFPAGDIALLQRGACAFADKVLNAQAAGATGVVLFNQGNGEGRTDIFLGTLGGPGATIPGVVIGFEAGAALARTDAQTDDVVFRLDVETVSEIRRSSNVFAETSFGDPDQVLMVGAHLDSVPEGPGINDNGSGSGAILEVATSAEDLFASGLASADEFAKVRFAWWGAEEYGLLGSEYYVATLPADELERIYAYLNFDMVGSPNGGRFVYDGDDSDGVGAGPGPEGSTQIEKLFVDQFRSQGLVSGGTDFSGRSDYGPFIEVGVPSGGLFTGAEDIATEEDARDFGSTPGVAYDPCYHLACDTIENFDRTLLDQMADAIADATARLALRPGLLDEPVDGPVDGRADSASPPVPGGGGLSPELHAEHDHDHDHDGGELS